MVKRVKTLPAAMPKSISFTPFGSMLGGLKPIADFMTMMLPGLMSR